MVMSATLPGVRAKATRSATIIGQSMDFARSSVARCLAIGAVKQGVRSGDPRCGRADF